jgi:hypothetical protein
LALTGTKTDWNREGLPGPIRNTLFSFPLKKRFKTFSLMDRILKCRLQRGGWTNKRLTVWEEV